MNRTRRVTLSLLAIPLSVSLAACGSIATGSSEVGLQYEGGAFESNAFYACVKKGTRDYIDWGDVGYYYPTGQRDFSFQGDGNNADAASITSTTKDRQEASVAGTVKFTVNLNCDKFTDPSGTEWPGGTAQFFHEKIGNKDPDEPAYNTTGSESYGVGWSNMLREYMGFAVNDALDDVTTRYTLDEVNLSEEQKSAWQTDVKDRLPEALKQMTFGVEVFKIESVVLQRPGVRKEIADARAQRVAADEQVAASNVIAERAKTWPGGLPAYQEFLREQAVNKAIAEGKVRAVPVPYGSPIIVDQNPN